MGDETQRQRTLNGYERKRYSKNHFLRYAERRLKLDYAMLRLPRSEVALKTQDQDPRVWFTAKHIPEHDQVALHLRMPVRDECNKIDDFIDLDIYFPKGQLAEIVNLLTDPTQPHPIEKVRSQTMTHESIGRFLAALIDSSRRGSGQIARKEISRAGLKRAHQRLRRAHRRVRR